MRYAGGMLAIIGILGPDSARADCLGPEIPEDIIPWNGNRVPRNAEIRFESFHARERVTVVPPAGLSERFDVATDAIGTFIPLETPLATGVYQVRFEGVEDDFTFTVVDDVDNAAPDSPEASAHRKTDFQGPRPPIFDDCPAPDTGFYDTVTIDIAGGTSGDLVFIDDVLVDALNEAGTSKIIRGEGRGGSISYAVTLRDFAGNVSDPTSVDMYAGCNGGCTASGPTVPLAFALAALSRRRPRNTSKA